MGNVEMEILDSLAVASLRSGSHTLRMLWQQGTPPSMFLESQPQASTARKKAECILAQCRRLGISVTVPIAPDYPLPLLDEGSWSTPLYYRGALPPATQPRIAVVGTRTPTWSGRAVAQFLGSRLAQLGAILVSGLAEGVDLAAHMGTLEQDGCTIAVLAHGLHHMPALSRGQTAQRILDAGGCLASPFHPGTEASRGTFVARNRIIAGISSITVLVESRPDGGAMHTANEALRLGRKLACVPGDPLAETSRGPHGFLRQGKAMALWHPDDLISWTGLADSSEFLLQGLGRQVLDADTVAAMEHTSRGEAIAILTRLELRGQAQALPGARWSVVKGALSTP